MSLPSENRKTLLNFLPDFLRGLSDNKELLHATSDITIIVDDKEYKSHKLLLCGVSGYFRTKITTQVGNSSNVIHLNNIDIKLFDRIFNSIYGSPLLDKEITLDQLKELVNMLDMLEINSDFDHVELLLFLQTVKIDNFNIYLEVIYNSNFDLPVKHDLLWSKWKLFYKDIKDIPEDLRIIFEHHFTGIRDHRKYSMEMTPLCQRIYFNVSKFNAKDNWQINLNRLHDVNRLHCNMEDILTNNIESYHNFLYMMHGVNYKDIKKKSIEKMEKALDRINRSMVATDIVDLFDNLKEGELLDVGLFYGGDITQIYIIDQSEITQGEIYHTEEIPIISYSFESYKSTLQKLIGKRITTEQFEKYIEKIKLKLIHSELA